MPVYVITRGDYNSYHIIGVSLYKDKAEHIAKMYSDAAHEARVEEYDADQFNDVEIPVWIVYFPVGMEPEARIYPYGTDRSCLPIITPLDPVTNYTGIVELEATSKRQAIEVAKDLARNYGEQQKLKFQQ